MQTRIYPASVGAEALAEKLRDWFAGKEYQTQIFRTNDGTFTVQGYRNDLLETALGFTAALTIQIRPLDAEQLEITLGAGAWGNKLFVAGLGLLIFLPLVLTAAWGSWQQYQLDQEVWAFIASLLASEPVDSLVPAAPLPRTWFDAGSGEVYAVQFFQRMESWQQAMADGRIDPAEVQQQAERVTQMLKAIEPTLTPEAHAKLTQAFGELAVLQGMQSYYTLFKPTE